MRNFYDLELANHFVPHQWLLNRHLETEKLEKFTKIASLKCDVELTFDFIFNAFKREEFYMKIRKGLMKIHHLGDKKQVKCIVRKLREINLTDFIENYQFLTPEEAILKSSIFIKNAKKKCWNLFENFRNEIFYFLEFFRYFSSHHSSQFDKNPPH